jgi:hypothetical protein
MKKLMNRFPHGAVYNLPGDGGITSIAKKTVEHVLQYTNTNYHLPFRTRIKALSVERPVCCCYATDFKRAKCPITHAAAIIDLKNTLLSLQFQTLDFIHFPKLAPEFRTLAR